MAATTLRPASVSAPAGALVGGGLLMVALVAVSSGGDLDAGPMWWIALAGGAACASGVMVRSSGQMLPAALFGVVAVLALVVAVTLSPAREGAEAAFPVRERLAPPPAATSPAPPEPPRRSRGNVPTATPEQLVRSYYAALDAGDFERAWTRLSPGVQAAFGSFETWRSGYATTLGHRVEDVQVRADGTVGLVLVATDRTPCGGQTEQRFAVTWRLEGRRAAALSAVRLAGDDPRAAC